MLAHIRRDEAIRSLPLWLVLSPTLTFFATLLGGGVFFPERDFEHLSTAAALAWVFGWAWLPLAIYLAYAQTRRRASDLDLVLPLPARRLWLAHGLSLGLGGAAILVLSIAFPAFLVVELTFATGVEMIAALRLVAGLVIAVAVLESREPALVRLTPGWANSLLVAAVLTAVPVLVLRLDGGWVIALLGLALALGFRTWRSLPAAFTLVPPPAASAAAADRLPAGRLGEQEWAAAGGGGGWRRFQLASQVVKSPLWTYLIIFAYGMFVAWVAVPGGSDVACLPVSVLVLFFLSLRPSRFSYFDPLPIGRKALFAALILPNALTLVLGWGAGRLALVVFGESRDVGMALPVVLLLVCLPWLLLMAIVMCAWRAGVPEWVTWAVIFLISIGGVLVAVFLLISPDPAAVALGESRAGTLAAWSVSALLLLCGYALAEASFERIELPGRPGGESGLGEDVLS